MTINAPLRCSFSSMAAPDGDGYSVLLNTGNYPSYSSYLNQTWVYVAASNTWVDRSTTLVDATGPLPGRSGAVLVYDGTQVMLNGGKGSSSTSGMYEDTWSWNGTAWTKLAPVVSPIGRFGAKAAYLAGYGTVMFGGSNAVNYLSPDTWVWSGSASTWTQVSTQGPPSGRKGHVMAANATQAVMFGGEGTNSLLNDTWSFSAGVWTKLTTAVVPSVRSNAVMCYDSTNSVYVLFGGADEYNYLDETWTLTVSGTVGTWTKVAVANGVGPSGRIGAQMSFDTGLHQALMFGGNTATANYPSNETWAFNGSTLVWTKLG